MRIAVYGAGGVGGYFGGRLARAGEDVSFVARGRHLEALRSRGLRVKSTFGDFDVVAPVTDDPASIGPVDFVLFTVKSQDTPGAASRLGPLLGPETGVVSLQNGLGNEEAIGAVIGPDHVLGGVAYILSTIGEPGLIVHSGGPASVVFGELHHGQTDRARRLLAAFERAGVDATLSDDVQAVLWDKFALICALSGATAAIRLPIGEIRETPESWHLYETLLDEAAAVAASEGVELSEATLQRQKAFALGLEPGVYSSLHYDMTNGKPMELESLQGELLRRAAAAGVPVPVSMAVYAILRPWAERNALG